MQREPGDEGRFREPLPSYRRHCPRGELPLSSPQCFQRPGHRPADRQTCAPQSTNRGRGWQGQWEGGGVWPTSSELVSPFHFQPGSEVELCQSPLTETFPLTTDRAGRPEIPVAWKRGASRLNEGNPCNHSAHYIHKELHAPEQLPGIGLGLWVTSGLISECLGSYQPGSPETIIVGGVWGTCVGDIVRQGTVSHQSYGIKGVQRGLCLEPKEPQGCSRPS